MRMKPSRFFMKALKAAEKNKKTAQEKAAETRQHSARLIDMQRYVDMSKEKRGLLLDLILNGKSSDTEETLLEKGVIIYVELLDVIEQITEDLEKAGIDYYVIQGSTKEDQRGHIAKEFKQNPNGKVVLISNAAGESLNLNGSNELILYDTPRGPGKFGQITGRVARMFSKFESEGRSFYIHNIIVEDTLDEYKPILLSSKKELEEQILHADTIPLKDQGSFDGMLLKELRKKMLWKSKQKKKK